MEPLKITNSKWCHLSLKLNFHYPKYPYGKDELNITRAQCLFVCLQYLRARTSKSAVCQVLCMNISSSAIHHKFV